MDIETVVALLTEIEIPNEQPRQAEFTFDNPIHNRMPIILDAISNVLVSKSRGEVIAVGLQQPTVGGIYTFVIASNGVIPNSTLEHARDLVADLQSLGSNFTEFQKGVEDDNIQANNTSVSEGELERASSPWMDENRFPIHLQTMVATFRAKICLFALPKIKQRLQKPWGGTTRGQSFVDFVETLPSNSQHRELQIIQDIYFIIRWMLRLFQIHPHQLPEEEIEPFVDGMTHIGAVVDELLKIKAWTAEIFRSSPFMPGFPLERFLKKMASTSNSTDTLLKYAYSPRLYRRYLNRAEIRILPLANTPRKIPLPDSHHWHQISRTILASNGEASLLDELSEAESPGSTLRKRFEGKQSITGPVHCAQAIPYIGVSKLSCLACWEFLKSLRSVGYVFYTRGSHAKAYFPWKYPDLEIEQAGLPSEEKSNIFNSLLSSLSGVYTEHLQIRERNRKLSDSSTEVVSRVTHRPVSIDRYKF
ncbi:hypothetical protein AJ80_09181 [Polytolypa hystricis UAMH7299]|uniref:Uncharacterized protein n=1 Tax=Polytolypa hystricis (strain UAMH7299) TaxID=1447883 RepID=A0A2B7WLZ8_POLH7|nr:hypothetical protein AJ80_09181 [Polytolypa hystricis UAMH7299]